MDRIIDESNKNIGALKALEVLVSERLLAYTTLQNSATKVKNAFEAFEGFSGTLKLALDSFYLYSEQVSYHSPRMHSCVYLNSLVL